MGRKVDRTGQRYGRLLVIRQVEIPAFMANRHLFWECRCDCGNVVQVSGSALSNGHTLSCGCLRRERVAALNKAGRKKKEAKP